VMHGLPSTPWELRLISTGISLPSLRRPVSSRPAPHRAGVRGCDVSFAVPHVPASESLRDQELDGVADQLVAMVAEQILDLAVHQHDGTGSIAYQDAVRRRLEKAEEPLVGHHTEAAGFTGAHSPLPNRACRPWHRFHNADHRHRCTDRGAIRPRARFRPSRMPGPAWPEHGRRRCPPGSEP
jgi:hypothetical protein